MEALGDYLYLIIFGGIIVFNIVKNLVKQKAPETTPDFSGNSTNRLLEKKVEYDDFFDNPYYSSPKEETVSYVEAKKKENSPLHSVNNNTRNIKKDSPLEENKHNENSVVTIENTDDARKAFIYSEIWNRKY